jgi:hypothetical protein
MFPCLAAAANQPNQLPSLSGGVSFKIEMLIEQNCNCADE